MELLANQVRPKKLSEIVGQTHLIGDGKILTNMVLNHKIFSFILYGKPGIGKTSIAYAMVSELGIRYRFLNATISKKEDFERIIEEAKMYGDMVLIVDEIHRMNKDKQDLLLPHIESGLIILIGLTTSNPYHKINPAIRSRVQIFELHELSIEDLVLGLQRAAQYLDGCILDEEAAICIATLSGGDFRSALNLLEVSFYSSNDHHITLDIVKNIHNKPVFFHDKNQDGHYDVLSAFQKSIRGSDVDASLHYLARLLEAGDLDSIYRRMSVIFYEDISLANPGLGPKIHSAIEACDLVGLPEAQIILASVIVEMALSPKSNSTYLAIKEAINDIHTGSIGSIPNHIKTNSPEYKYAHNYKNDYVKQEYLPENLRGKKYYHAKNNKVEQNMNHLWHEMKGE